MRRLTLLGILAAVVIAVTASSLSAQSRPTKLVFVDSQAVLRAHPAGQAVEALRAQAQTEVKGLTDSIAALEAKLGAGQTLTPDESERYATLRTTLQAVQTRYLNDIEAAAAPAVQATNVAITELAKENGYTVVLDRVEAANQRIVVYADDDLDITQLVIDRVTAGN
ncbi:MAG TPA: OmpH family outer membrane protein [Trueperaceae bacterium]|nr:OmpH family outer membrane protein [Trueperaceae bacterium]